MEDIKKNLKENVLLYTGSENEEERIIAKKLFTDTLDHNILIGTDAMSESLNLQVAKYVINIDQPDTCAIKVQRLGRVRRAGSTFKDVVIYDMITEDSGDIKSKDEERLKNIQKNQDLSGALIDIDESQRIALINAMKEEV
jgi:superfamily II DNA/RNA helicase